MLFSLEAHKLLLFCLDNCAQLKDDHNRCGAKPMPLRKIIVFWFRSEAVR